MAAGGTFSGCVNNDAFLGDWEFDDGSYSDCDWYQWANDDQDACNEWGDDPDVGGGPLTANKACCVCGGVRNIG